MKILFLGDVFGRPGRQAVQRYLPGLRREYAPDMVIVNGENARHGFGISPDNARELFDAGADVLTGGNHSWDSSDIIAYIKRTPNLLRPLNWIGSDVPGQGSVVFETTSGHRVLVISLLCQLFINDSTDPFSALDRQLPSEVPVHSGLDAVVIDCHGEATSEKLALGHFVDGRASLLVGTHTHVPTADARILAFGTGYMTDAGMCGDYDSVIGVNKEIAIQRFLGRVPKPRMQPADGDGGVSGVLIETEPTTGLCRHIQTIQQGLSWTSTTGQQGSTPTGGG